MTLSDLTPTATALPGGISLAHVRAGTGPAVIFIHGAMGDWRSWAPQWDGFVQDFDCISYSRRYSHPNPNPMTSRSHNALVDAADLLALMDALEIEEAALVGSSYGGFTALAAAVRAPGRVRAVVSVEAPMMRYALAAPGDARIARDFLAAAAEPARAAFERGDDEAGVRALTGGIVGKSPEDLPAGLMARRMQNAAAARSLSLSEDEFPLIPAADLAALPMPVLLMTGAETAPVHRAIFRNVAAAMPQARTLVVEGSGHSVSQQRPDVFNAAARAFLDDALAPAH